MPAQTRAGKTHQPSPATNPSLPSPVVPVWRDLITLAKPRILLLLAITSLAGVAVAARGNPALLNWHKIIFSTLGLVVSAAGANAVNMWYDRDIDALMRRTLRRPLPCGRLSPAFVLIYGSLLVLLGSWLAALATLLSGLMALAGALFYIFIYTLLLKRRTVQNIVIGGAAGAFPPLVGWAALQGNLDNPLPWLMFAIIFFWTPPHFWALALVTNADYTKAGVPMYPVVHGENATRLAIIRYLTILLPITLAGGLIHPLGWLYLVSAIGLGSWWFVGAFQLLKAPPTSTDPKPARKVFSQSLSYLALLFLAMVIDSWL